MNLSCLDDGIWQYFSLITYYKCRTYAVGGSIGVFGRASPAQTPQISLKCVTPKMFKSLGIELTNFGTLSN